MKLSTPRWIHIGMRKHNEPCTYLNGSWQEPSNSVRKQSFLVLSQRQVMYVTNETVQ